MGRKMTNEERLAYGLELSRQYQSQINLAGHGVTAILTLYLIKFGLLLGTLKDLVKQLGLRWERWADANLSHLPKRTRVDYMALAEIPDAPLYAFLGKERLLLLKREAKNKSIGEFLKKHQIPFDPRVSPEDERVVDLKFYVDAAIFLERAEKANVVVPMEQIKTLVAMGVKVDSKLISNIALLQKNGGNSETYLQALIENRGVEESVFTGEGKVQSIVKLKASLKTTVNALLQMPNSKMLIDAQEVEEMEELIRQLKAYIEQ